MTSGGRAGQGRPPTAGHTSPALTPSLSNCSASLSLPSLHDIHPARTCTSQWLPPWVVPVAGGLWCLPPAGAAWHGRGQASGPSNTAPCGLRAGGPLGVFCSPVQHGIAAGRTLSSLPMLPRPLGISLFNPLFACLCRLQVYEYSNTLYSVIFLSQFQCPKV